MEETGSPMYLVYALSFLAFALFVFFWFYVFLKFTKGGQRTLKAQSDVEKRPAWAARHGYHYKAGDSGAFELEGQLSGQPFTMRCWHQSSTKTDSSGNHHSRSDTYVELRCNSLTAIRASHPVMWSLDHRESAFLNWLSGVFSRLFGHKDPRAGMKPVRLATEAEKKLRLVAHDVALAQRVWTPQASSQALKILASDVYWLSVQGGSAGLQIKIEQTMPNIHILEQMISLAELLQADG
jgi:hypothetical protein